MTDSPLVQSIPSESVSDDRLESWKEIAVYMRRDVKTVQRWEKPFKLKAVDAKGQPHSIPDLTLTRGARHIAFLDGKRSLIVLRGDLHHKNLWAIDLETGAERQLTNFAPGFELRVFDV